MQPATTAADLAIPACFLIAEPEKVSLSDCLINVDVQSRIAIIEQTQEFHNRSDEVQEVTYAFPDGGDGVFLEMTACLDGQEVVLEVRENTKAEKIYEQARDEGNLPVLSKNLGEGVNCIHLGKLAPGSRVQVKSRFAAPIKFIGDRGQLRIPTTIAPRYGINRDAQRAQAMPDASLLAEHPLKLSVAVGGAMRHLEVSCPSHQLKTVAAANGGDRKCRMLFEEAYKDRDIVLQFAGRPPANMGFAVNNPFVKPAGRVVWLDVLADAAKTTHPKNLHFLIDCSGSMHGDGQRLAGEFLKSFAALIDAQDTIGISIFGSGYQLLFAGQCGAQINRHTFVGAAYEDMGGTELGRALQATLADRHEGADIVLVTDGEVHEGEELVAQMHESNCRIFAVGIGAAPRQSLLESLATATEGNCDFLSANMDSDKIAKSCAQLAECGRQRISAISWPGSVEPQWCSPLPQTIHPDLPLPIAAFFAGDQAPAQATVTIDGKESVIAIDDLGDGRSRELSKLAAARHCKSSRDEDESLRLALAYGLVTEATSLVGVIKPTEKMVGESASTVIRPMLAIGWGGIGTSRDNYQREHSCVNYLRMMPMADEEADAPAVHAKMAMGDSMSTTDNSLINKSDPAANYRRDVRDFAATGRLPNRRKGRFSLPHLHRPQQIIKKPSIAAPEKVLLNPDKFREAMQANKNIDAKIAAMGEVFQELCQKVASKDQERFCTILEKVVTAKMEPGGVIPQFDDQTRLDKFLTELLWDSLPDTLEGDEWTNRQLPEHGLARFLAVQDPAEKAAALGDSFLGGLCRQISGHDAERFCKTLDALVTAKVTNQSPAIATDDADPLLSKLFEHIFADSLDAQAWENSSLPGRCPLRFLAAEKTANKIAAMSALLKKICLKVAKGNEDEFCRALQKVVLARLKNQRLTTSGEFSELDGQFFEHFLNGIIAPHLPAESWRVGWNRFLDSVGIDVRVGKMIFTVDMRENDSPASGNKAA